MKYNRQQHKLETKEDSFEEIDRFLNYWDYDYDDWCNDYDAVCDYCGVWSCYHNDNVYKCSGKEQYEKRENRRKVIDELFASEEIRYPQLKDIYEKLIKEENGKA